MIVFRGKQAGWLAAVDTEDKYFEEWSSMSSMLHAMQFLSKVPWCYLGSMV